MSALQATSSSMISTRRTLRWSHRILLIFVGALTALSFAPFHFYPIPFFSMAIMLWYLYHANSKRQAIGSVLYFCLGLYAAGIHWIYVSIYYYGGTPLHLAIAANAIVVLYLCFVMMWVGLITYLARRLRGLSWLLVAASAWMLAEGFRGWFMGGFPWLQLAFSQTDSLLAGYFPVIGSMATNFLLVLAAGGIMFGLLQRQVIALIIPILILFGGFLLKPIEWTIPSGEAVSVALIQGNVDQSIKWDPADFENQWERYTEASANALTRNPDIIIWPETALTNLYNGQSGDRYLLSPTQKAMAKSFDTDLIFGTFWEENNELPGNALIHIDPKTQQESLYLKYHLLSFAETMPFSPLSNKLYKFISKLDVYPMAQGEQTQPLFEVAGIKIAPFICFESAFGNELIDTTRESDLLLNVSNDTWFRDSIAGDQHFQINRVRAIESRRWLARGTNTGHTAIVDHFGTIIATLPRIDTYDTPHRAEFLIEKVKPRSGYTPYQQIGDSPWYIFWLLLVIAGILFGRPTTPTSPDRLR